MALGDYGEHEIEIQDEIRRGVQDASHLVIYLTTFLLSRDDGRQHKVLVLPLRGPYLWPIIVKRLPMATRMFAARQLLETLGNLHKAGFIHRDLNEMNCMWGIAPLDNFSREEKYKALGRPLKKVIPVVKIWKQGELVRPVRIPEKLRTEDFYLSDFALAMKLGDSDSMIPKGYPPMHFCSPDRLHKQKPSFACDIWSYMVLFGELYLSHPPFYFARKGGTVSAFVQCLGPLPEQWKGLYTHPDPLDFWYDQNTLPSAHDSLESVIERFRPDADPIEKKHVLSLMQKVFVYDPEKRPTAAQLLQDPSFRALMERYGC